MSPIAEKTDFGSITIDGETYSRDIIIRRDGAIKKRKKKLSSKKYGTAHKVSRKEAKFIFERGVRNVIFGTGQEDSVRLSRPAQRYFDKHEVHCILEPTPIAIATFNQLPDPKVGVFHVTC
jgi:hypothetical protein